MQRHLLNDDPDLAGDLEGERLSAAREELLVETFRLRSGDWHPGDDPSVESAALGLLVLQGALIRQVICGSRRGGELLGTGDLLRPLQDEGAQTVLPHRTRWRVIAATELAVLDRRFATRAAAYPEVVIELVARAMQRSRQLSVNAAITHHFRMEPRLLMLLWHLADRWGRVTPAGVELPAQISQSVLADLIAAHRPSVTVAMRTLTEAGYVSRTPDALVLHGEPPASEEDILGRTAQPIA